MSYGNIVKFLSEVLLQKSPATSRRYRLKKHISKIPVFNFDLLKHEFSLKVEHVIWKKFVLLEPLKFLQVEMPIETIKLKRHGSRQVDPLKVKKVALGVWA
jgi:hypothetical protein